MEHYCKISDIKKSRFLSQNCSNERLILKEECSIHNLYISKIYKFKNIRICDPNLLINEQKDTIEYFVSNLKTLTIDCSLFSLCQINKLINFNNQSKFILLNRLDKLKTLNIINCVTFKIFNNKLNNLNNLKELYIDTNHFSGTVDDFFNNLTFKSQLKKLKFSCVESHLLQKNIFDKLSNLEILIIGIENNSELANIFSKLNNLKVLEITCSNFIDKSSNILNLPNLKILKINCFHFGSETEHSFDKLINLETLIFNIFNFSHSLYNSFDKLTNLKSLSFYCFRINLKSNYEKNEYIFDKLIKLERLSINSVCLINLENSLDKLINLKKLKIASNEFYHPLNEIFDNLIVQNKLRVVKIICGNEIFMKRRIKYGNLLNLEKLSINCKNFNKSAKGSEEIKILLDEIKMS